MGRPTPSIVDEILAHSASRRRGPQCWTCRLPRRFLVAIHEAQARRAELTAIADWLKGKLPPGVQVPSESSVSGHFRKGHQVPKS